MPACTQCSSAFDVTPDDLAFLESVAPVFAGKKESIPAPTLCPDCRMQRRLAFRNERKLYHRKCDLTGRQIVSVYAPDTPVTVYQSDEWFSDKWDAKAYGRSFDFTRPFFDQFAELKHEVPRMSLITSPDAEAYNCSYINFSGHSRNCFMTFDSDYNEDSLYTKVLKHSKFCVDCSFTHHSELCYDCTDCANCYNLQSSENCSNCSDSAFLYGCTGCRNCLLCVNLVQKEYCIGNKQYSKEDYHKELAAMHLSSHAGREKLRAEFRAFSLQFPRKRIHSLKTENVIGDYLLNARDCHRCFDIGDAEQIRYCDAMYKTKSCMDVSSFGENTELCYECATAGIDCYNMRFCFECVISCSDLLYCDECRQASSCFGCVGVRGKYCILNKQYTKEEYDVLVPKIIAHMRTTGEWGEFFPPSISLFGYNETVAPEYFPLSNEEVIAKGWKWRDESGEQQYMGPAYDIPDAIADVGDDILKAILQCAVSGKPYRILPQELKYYREHAIPVPRACPDQRHLDRLALRNPRKLWNRECAKCSKQIETSYAPDRPEIVYCEQCYLEAVY